MLKICVICQKEYSNNYPNSKTCCKEHGDELQRRYQVNYQPVYQRGYHYRIKNKEYRSNYYKQRRINGKQNICKKEGQEMQSMS
jgi:hypothetical protein